MTTIGACTAAAGRATRPHAEPVQQGQEDADDHQLADLDPDVEQQQGHRAGLLGQSDVGKRPGEAEPVQQAEPEGDRPR